MANKLLIVKIAPTGILISPLIGGGLNLHKRSDYWHNYSNLPNSLYFNPVG